MRNTILIIKHEIITTLQKRSFWVMTILFPAIIMLLSVGSQFIGQKAIETAEESASSVEDTADGIPIGYVDEAGAIDALPAWLPSGYLAAYPDADAAQAALEAGSLRQYYLIPEDFYETGEFILVDSDFQPMRSSSNAEIFERILMENLIAKEPLGLVLDNPTPNINEYALAPPSGRDDDNPLTYFVPFVTLFVFFFIITTTSGFMLTSVTREKENRTAETLLVSLRPRELMLGKVIGLGCIALLQMSIWLGGGLLALDRSNQFIQGAQDYTLPPGFVVWALLFFIFGYFLYAAILGSIGVMVPNAREGGQFTFVAILPLMIPLWFNVAFTESPDGPVATFLSLFPLTAPSAMMTRLAASNVPTWQILVSLLGLALTAYLFVLLSSKLFRADNLLSSDSFSWKRLTKELRRVRSSYQ
ncbi:MAG: ABC transporter permease [Chloroflexota bacterium]